MQIKSQNIRCELAFAWILSSCGIGLSLALWRRNCVGQICGTIRIVGPASVSPDPAWNWPFILTMQGSVCVYTVNTYSKDDVTLDLVRGKYLVFNTGSIQWFIEDQALSRCNDLAPLPTLSPLPSVSWTGDAQEDWERETTCCREMGEWDGRGAESYDRKKAWSSINHSILFDSTFLTAAGPLCRGNAATMTLN
jgi:hypothetical protein